MILDTISFCLIGRTEELQAHIAEIEGGRQKYHSIDVATAACKHLVSNEVTAETVRSCQTVAQVKQSEIGDLGCLHVHPGLCKTKHAGIYDDALKLGKTLPKKSAIFKFERKTPRSRNGLILYVRSILGVVLLCCRNTIKQAIQRNPFVDLAAFNSKPFFSVIDCSTAAETCFGRHQDTYANVLCPAPTSWPRFNDRMLFRLQTFSGQVPTHAPAPQVGA